MPPYQPPSPIDEIEGLEEVPPEQVAKHEERLMNRFKDEREQRIADGEAREAMRKIRLY